MPPPLILASRSPQRREILAQLGVEFEVRVPGVDELAAGEAVVVAGENARRKAAAVAPGAPAGARVLGADTVVALDDRILGKPADVAEAEAMLTALGGREHRVVSAVCVLEAANARTAAATARVRFRSVDTALRRWYLATGEWRDRAGAYAIQGRGAALVRWVHGDYTAVVGLPVGTVLDLVPDLLRTS